MLCELEPPPMEPPGYREWRRFLLEDTAAACEMGNNEGKPYFKFMADTEFMLSSKQKNAEAQPLDDLAVFAWDKDEGVWVLEGSAEIFDNLQRLLGRDLLRWHEALERCGAVYYSHWRYCLWSKAALEVSVKNDFGWRPFFQSMSDLRSLQDFEVEDAKL
ncbi:hypothetical protein N7467_007656 [Penicillium canescens]|nr:hypothetical protein N7467_007656 [Penicillium canescens]